jgi:hypothetical protein
LANTVEIKIYPDPAQPPSIAQAGIPWFAGMTALQAMIVGESMNPKNFAFRVEYRSIYGAQIDAIDGLADGDQPDHYWLFFVDGQESQVGVSEAVLSEDATKTYVLIEWKYSVVQAASSSTLALKTQSLGNPGG